MDGLKYAIIRLKSVLRVSLCLGAFFLLLEIARVTIGPNWHTIIPGKLYRSAHLSEEELLTAHQRFGIKTIINLRGKCPWEPWYQDEGNAVDATGMERIDLNLSAYLPPGPKELQKLWQALESAPRPILIHCRRGADRTGLTSTLALMHDHDSLPVETACQQLSLRAGHIGLGRVEVMGNVLDDYQTWLAESNQLHSRSTLKHWIYQIYRPGQCWARVEPISLPEYLELDQPHVIRVRLHNESYLPWHFQRASHIGVHLRGHIQPRGAKAAPGADPFSEPPDRRKLSAGFKNVVVPPQQSIELDVALPALSKPGPYTLYLDIYDEQMRCFGESVGSPVFKRTLEVRRGPVAQR